MNGAPPPSQGHVPNNGGGHLSRQFPPSFGLYVDSVLSRKFVLGEHQSQPLYAVSVHVGWSGQPSTVLHNGPSTKHPPLAAADASTFGSSSTVDLPPLPQQEQQQQQQERLKSAGGLCFNKKMRFAVEVGGHRETFEWRHSRGPEVAALGGSHAGWKLVRLSTDAPDGGGGGGGGAATFVQGGAKSSDGLEVVAVWANARMSLTKQLQFQFLGSGAGGILGERWALMAVITALRMWDQERRRKSRSRSGAAAGGGAGGA
ncbi:hypothetical protein MGN70_000075 [Eutypa lata]|nr:hypothetical protein MGN70_000075 [Eutypa lata]